MKFDVIRVRDGSSGMEHVNRIQDVIRQLGLNYGQRLASKSNEHISTVRYSRLIGCATRGPANTE